MYIKLQDLECTRYWYLVSIYCLELRILLLVAQLAHGTT